MHELKKACPIVIRPTTNGGDVLAFAHPMAGKQFVKGTVEVGESPLAAAIRELREESGLRLAAPFTFIGVRPIGGDLQPWYFFKCISHELPENWSYRTEDDFGHEFEFFWHSLKRPLDQEWLPVFHEAFEFFAPLCIADRSCGL